MPLKLEQLELTEEYQQTFAEQIQSFEAAPEELQNILKRVWTRLEDVTMIQDDPTAKLAAVSALIHLRELGNDFQPEDIQTLIDLLIGQALA